MSGLRIAFIPRHPICPAMSAHIRIGRSCIVSYGAQA
jgi:hypothetical protein